MGGDEFAILLVEMKSFDDEHIIIRHLQDNLKMYNKQFAHNYALSLSIGVSIFNPEHPITLETLLKQADMLMYEDKKNQKS
jgi:diguanylate cyclase (GGDEF)-like protein